MLLTNQRFRSRRSSVSGDTSQPASRASSRRASVAEASKKLKYYAEHDDDGSNSDDYANE